MHIWKTSHDCGRGRMMWQWFCTHSGYSKGFLGFVNHRVINYNQRINELIGQQYRMKGQRSFLDQWWWKPACESATMSMSSSVWNAEVQGKKCGFSLHAVSFLILTGPTKDSVAKCGSMGKKSLSLHHLLCWVLFRTGAQRDVGLRWDEGSPLGVVLGETKVSQGQVPVLVWVVGLGFCCIVKAMNMIKRLRMAHW